MSRAALNEKVVSAPAPRSNVKYRRIAATLKERIGEGTYAVGTALPTMKNLAREFDASFGTVFGAVQLLSGDNLVSTAGRRNGAVVYGHHDGYNVLFGDGHAAWYGDPNEKMIWMDLDNDHYREDA